MRHILPNYIDPRLASGYLRDRGARRGDIVVVQDNEMVYDGNRLESLAEGRILPENYQVIYEFKTDHWNNLLSHNSEIVRYFPPQEFYNALECKRIELTESIWVVEYRHDLTRVRIAICDLWGRELSLNLVRELAQEGIFRTCIQDHGVYEDLLIDHNIGKKNHNDITELFLCPQ